MEGIKRKRRCEIECKEHIFSVQTLKASTSKYDIQLLFCPKYQREPLPPEHTYPEYNNDDKFYTSAFILGVDRRVLQKNEQQELMDHQKQIRDSLEKHNQLVFPRPNSKHSLCSVCKEHYKNYYLHIASDQHRERIALSLYNHHIRDLCLRYVSLWDGAEERADAEAEVRAQEEEERRQRVAELAAQQVEEEDEEEDEDELLDVQRGDRFQENEEDQDDDEEEDDDANYPAKPLKKHSKSVFKDDDTIPFTAKTNKRLVPECRAYTSEYLRKKFLLSERAHREREERRYERERDKIKTERDNPERSKQFVKINEKEGDVFIIMKAAFAMPQPQQSEFVWKRTTDRFRIKDALPDGTPNKFEKENKKYQIQCGEDKLANEPSHHKDGEDFRHYHYYAFPPYPPYEKPQEHKTMLPEEHYYKEYGKTLPDSKKNVPDYYHHPYMYPPVYEPYAKSEIGSEASDKDKIRADKMYEYPPFIPYPWPYNPYYMVPPPIDHKDQIASDSKPENSTANSNANINFPMYMYAPHHSMQGPYSSRYPPHPQMLPPYIGYQHPYSHNQTTPNREDYSPPATSMHPQHPSSIGQQVPPAINYPPYLPPYPPSYQFQHHEISNACSK